MPRGGWRGGGRPTKAMQAERARVLLESIKPGEELDTRALLEAIIRNPDTPKTDRFRAIELHMKLPPKPPPSVVANEVLQPLSIPRGAQFAEDGRTLIWPETGKPVEPSEMVPVVPFEGTPPWPAETSPRRSKLEPELERLEVTEVPDDGKVATLRPYGRIYSSGRKLAAGPEDILVDDDDGAA